MHGLAGAMAFPAVVRRILIVLIIKKSKHSSAKRERDLRRGAQDRRGLHHESMLFRFPGERWLPEHLHLVLQQIF